MKEGKKYKFYICLYQKLTGNLKDILAARETLIKELDLNEDECDMREFYPRIWVPIEQIVVEGKGLRMASFIGNPFSRYNI